jgi:hypothetical protein
MIWLFAALVILLFIVLAGRAHSRHLDALEARWRSPSLDNSMIDENWEHLRARWNNVRRYRQLLQTELTELERRHIERRLNEDRSAIERGATLWIGPLHTTQQAGPHRAVREVEVVRDGGDAVGPPSLGSARP